MVEPVAELLALAARARELEQYEAALLVFRRVRELAPENLVALEAIVELADNLGRSSEATDARLGLVERCIHGSRLEQASAIIAEILAVEPDQALALSYREFVDGRLNPEAIIGEAAVVIVADPDDEPDPEPEPDDEITAPVTVVDAAAGVYADRDLDDDDEDEWEARTTGVIAAGNMAALLAKAEAGAAVATAAADDDFGAPMHTIALDGQSAAVALAGLIRSSPLLRMVDSASCSRLLSESAVIQCFADQVVAERGSDGDSLLLILEGAAVIERNKSAIETVAAGEFFGEAALLGKTGRIATLRMTGDGLILEIGRRLVKQLSTRHPPLLDLLAHVLRRRAIAIQRTESPFLRRVPRALLEELAPMFHLHRLGAGDVVVRRDQVPTGYWEIVDGSLEATGGRIFAAGSAFGAGALRDEPSPVTMTATDSSWLLELPVGDLRKMLERYPKLGEPVDR